MTGVAQMSHLAASRVVALLTAQIKKKRGKQETREEHKGEGSMRQDTCHTIMKS
jgi:hypothetical protein